MTEEKLHRAFDLQDRIQNLKQKSQQVKELLEADVEKEIYIRVTEWIKIGVPITYLQISPVDALKAELEHLQTQLTVLQDEFDRL